MQRIFNNCSHRGSWRVCQCVWNVLCVDCPETLKLSFGVIHVVSLTWCWGRCVSSLLFVHLSQHGNSLLQFVQARASSIYVGAGCFLTTCCICCVAGIDANMSSLLQDNIQTMPSIEVASICLCVHSAMLIAAAGLARTTRFSVTAGWDALENCWCENIINCKGE